MAEYKVQGVESERTGEVHLWITRDGVTLEMEDICADLTHQQEEIERLHESLSHWTSECASLTNRVHEWAAEAERLREEVERLRTELFENIEELEKLREMLRWSGRMLAAREAGGDDE